MRFLRLRSLSEVGNPPFPGITHHSSLFMLHLSPPVALSCHVTREDIEIQFHRTMPDECQTVESEITLPFASPAVLSVKPKSEVNMKKACLHDERGRWRAAFTPLQLSTRLDLSTLKRRKRRGPVHGPDAGQWAVAAPHESTGKHPTSNIQRPTSKKCPNRRPLDVRGWRLNVECSWAFKEMVRQLPPLGNTFKPH